MTLQDMFEDGEQDPNTRVGELMREQLAVFESRIPKYGNSWVAEGIDGLIYNILRKFGRLWAEVMVQGRMPDANETLDLANYAIMLQALADTNPDSVKEMRVVAKNTNIRGVKP